MKEKSNVLLDIFKLYPDVWLDKRRFKSLLSDFLPENKIYKNLLYFSVEENIPQDIKKTTNISQKDIHYWRKRLVDTCGCKEELALQIIELWIEAFGVPLERNRHIASTFQK